MLRKLRLLLWLAFIAMWIPCAEAATPQDAQAMAEKAANYLTANGAEKAFAAISDPHGPFRIGDLYVFAHDATGLVVAHGGNPALIGKNTVRLTDVDGKSFVKEIVEVASTGWVDYKWQNPETKELSPKTVYVIRVGDYLICAGAYK
jgi:cytochrome c